MLNYFSMIVCLTVWAGVAFGYNGQESEDFVGPYATAMDNLNPLAPDAGIAGFVGPSGRGACPPGANDEQPSGEVTHNYRNPVFKQWAYAYENYFPAPVKNTALIGHETYAPAGGVPAMWRKPYDALGPVTGDNFDVCVLGDLWQAQLDVLDPAHPGYAANAALVESEPNKIQPGHITLRFEPPIQDGPGPDFAVFENGFISAGGAGVGGQIFAELAYVEVSTDGITFVRFPSVSLTEPTSPNGGTGAYGTVDPSNVYNLAGKHVNAYESSWGTPFNLRDLADYDDVLDGSVNLQAIYYIRIVDIPGNGFFKDEAQNMIDLRTIDPNTALGGTAYGENHGIHDAWVTWGSGGHDLEAIGVIEQLYGDADSDGDVDFDDFIRLAARWQRHGYWPQGDFNENGFVDLNDLLLLSINWLYQTAN